MAELAAPTLCVFCNQRKPSRRSENGKGPIVDAPGLVTCQPCRDKHLAELDAAANEAAERRVKREAERAKKGNVDG